MCAPECRNVIPVHFPCVLLDQYIVIPNHLHGIIIVGVNNHSPNTTDIANNHSPHPMNVTNNHPQMDRAKNFSPLRKYGISKTKWVQENANIQIIWQRNYFEHIIWDDQELNRIREYIIHNSIRWENDEYYFHYGASLRERLLESQFR
jgi:putative transposase